MGGEEGAAPETWTLHTISGRAHVAGRALHRARLSTRHLHPPCAGPTRSAPFCRRFLRRKPRSRFGTQRSHGRAAQVLRKRTIDMLLHSSEPQPQPLLAVPRITVLLPPPPPP